MHRDQIIFPPKHLALREDVHQLGILVGEVLREQGGETLYSQVEQDRLDAIKRRGDQGDLAAFEMRIQGRAPALARDLVRAFSTWFQSVNLAERVHRIRRRREYFQTDEGKAQPGGIGDALRQLKASGLSLQEALGLVTQLRIEPVFTAHPTDSTRRTQLRRQQRMASALLDRLNPNLEPSERRHLWQKLRTEITTGWQTEEHARQRLTVADEREFAMFHFAEVLYRIIPVFYEEILTGLEELYGTRIPDLELPALVHFGTWVGGDMEGAPEISSRTIRESLQRQQQVIVNEYFAECQQLAQLLSQSTSRVEITAGLKRRIDEYQVLLPSARIASTGRQDQMPYRMFFTQVGERLRQTYDGRANRYERTEQLRADLLLAAQSLLAHQGMHAGYQLVRRLLLRVDTFGLHLATLDLKQRSDVHHRVLAQGLDEPGWMGLSSAVRTERLAQILARDEGPRAPLDALGRRTLAVFDTALQCRNRFGAAAIGHYVVADATGADDMLAPLVLARWAGAENRSLDEANLDYAPMFESYDSLDGAGQALTQLLQNPHYAAHLRVRAQPQSVLIGYSQGSRDSGFFATRLAAHDAQYHVANALKAAPHGFVVTHARGGSVARGGMRVDALIGSIPNPALGSTLNWTEQGETIGQGYGLRSNALRTLERAFGALSLAVRHRQTGQRKRPREATLSGVAQLATRSREVWRQLMVDNREFADFFRAATPIDVIERMQVGVRTIWDVAQPGQSVLALRSTPWVFAWSQARYFLPGWYGAGTALQEIIAAQGVNLLQDARQEWPFFAALLADLESQLARTDLAIAERYALLSSENLRHFAQPLRAEYQRCCEAVIDILGNQALLDGDRTQQRAIQLRNPYVDPMNLLQIDLLRRWRATGREDDDLLQALLASITGIAQGLQTTG